MPVTVTPVDALMAELEHPLKAEVQALREIVLGANPAIAAAVASVTLQA